MPKVKSRRKKRESRLSLIARMGVRYIPFQIDPHSQTWVKERSDQNELTSGDLISLVLEDKAKTTPRAANSKFLKRLAPSKQMALELDYTDSFLLCEVTDAKDNLSLCLIEEEKSYDLKLLTLTAQSEFNISKTVRIGELSLNEFKRIFTKSGLKQTHPTVNRIKHWFANRVELWGLSFG